MEQHSRPDKKNIAERMILPDIEIDAYILNAIIQNSYDGIFITDGQAIAIMINQAYEHISGLRAEQVLGRSMKELVNRGLISESGTLLVLEKRAPVTLEQRFQSGCRAIITSSPIFDENGNITMVVTNVRDVTEIFRLQEELKQSEEKKRRSASEAEVLRRQMFGSEELIAVDKNMLNVLRMVDRVARLDTTVLLLGETGVGKEEIAKHLYQSSGRSRKQFIKVNCGAIPAELIESELFGYEKGAFTGASREGKIGLFEVADQGTIFLDEVGELPLDMQVKLLRVLQEQEIERIGSNKTIKINVRILAATNRDLQEMVKKKLFREDLYYRLNVFPITIPPLRNRPDDIIPFSKSFLIALNKKYGMQKTFDQSALDSLKSYDWPGNVRELKNIVERAAILSNGKVVSARDLALQLPFDPGGVLHRNFGEGDNGLPPQAGSLKEAVAQLEMQYIEAAYKKYGNVREAAASLGMDASTFVRKRKRYGG